MKNTKGRIGILTFHDTLNYGASMQCYALQKKLALMGANVQVIDYKCPKFVREYSPFYISQLNFRKILYMLVALKMNIIKQCKKKKFQKKHMRLSKTYTPGTISEANDEYATIIIGSDQVWNWHLTGFDKTYFLDFVKPGIRKYAYAASFGVSEIETDKQEEYQRLLEGYVAISVREESGVKLIEQMRKETPQIVVDPVLLLTAREWKKVAVAPSMKGYILLYSINDTIAYEYAKTLVGATGKQLVYLSAPLKKYGSFKKVTAPGPDEFLGWFYSADYIVTDSFHGVVTAILFHKQFVALQDRSKIANANSRVWDLLGRLSLTNRVVDSIEQIDVMKKVIDYVQVQHKLDSYINISIKFLEKIVEENNE